MWNSGYTWPPMQLIVMETAVKNTKLVLSIQAIFAKKNKNHWHSWIYACIFNKYFQSHHKIETCDNPFKEE